jgi:hypothetical protein
MPPSNLNLALMNLFVGMCKGVIGLPRDFRKLQYVDKWIELRFANVDQEQVAPELIVSSRLLNHTILFEWKTGPNFAADQLRRCSRVSRMTFVSEPHSLLKRPGHTMSQSSDFKNMQND